MESGQAVALRNYRFGNAQPMKTFDGVGSQSKPGAHRDKLWGGIENSGFKADILQRDGGGQPGDAAADNAYFHLFACQ